jgi:hypothetical protein
MACNCKIPFINCKDCSCNKTVIPTVLTAIASAEVKEMVNEDMEMEDPENDEEKNEHI